MVILPTKPYMPRHKGKVEAGVKYVQNNGLKGAQFTSLEEQNRHLAHWEGTVADTRIHGTTQAAGRQGVRRSRATALAAAAEGAVPVLPGSASGRSTGTGTSKWPRPITRCRRSILGRTVWVRWDARLVRYLQSALRADCRSRAAGAGPLQHPGATHCPREDQRHRTRRRLSADARSAAIGAQTHAMGRSDAHARGIEGTRVLQGLLSLTRQHPARGPGKSLRNRPFLRGLPTAHVRASCWARTAEQQTPLPFLDEHPIIRPLDDYGRSGRRGDPSPRQSRSLGRRFSKA